MQVFVKRLCVDGLPLGAIRSNRAILRIWKQIPHCGNDLRHSDESGFTIIELALTLTLMSILMAMSAGAFSYYLAGKSLETAATELTSQMREAESLAVATGNTYRIDFSDPGRTTYTLQRRQGADWVNVRDPQKLSGVEFSSSTPPSFNGDAYMEFYARGTCESGRLVITSSRYGKIKSLQVEGETVSVSVT
ncbi:MAG: pilus assembly FimT family protein [Thermoleophilia bacterium]